MSSMSDFGNASLNQGYLGLSQPGLAFPYSTPAQRDALSNAYNQWSQALGQQQRPYDPVFAQKAAPAASTKEPDVATNDSLIPDISLARVLKWAVVLLIAMALGRKVWDQFGDKITKQMHKALDAAS